MPGLVVDTDCAVAQSDTVRLKNISSYFFIDMYCITNYMLLIMNYALFIIIMNRALRITHGDTVHLLLWCRLDTVALSVSVSPSDEKTSSSIMKSSHSHGRKLPARNRKVHLCT